MDDERPGGSNQGRCLTKAARFPLSIFALRTTTTACFPVLLGLEAQSLDHNALLDA